MSDNHDQVEFLSYFLDDENSFDYAVLIDAPWGSGKTHFLRKYLAEKFPGPHKAGDPADYLWVSLFGKTSTAEVQDALYTAAHPMLSSKWAALGGRAASQAIKKFTGIEAGKQLVADFMPEIKAKLVVFDDLERTSIKPADALGLINSFVESRDFKVIVIANQKPFAEDADYRAQKEKVIGRTLTVMSNPEDVLTALTEDLRSEEAKAAINACRVELLAVFRFSELNNFRSLRAALGDFDRLVRDADARLASNPVALKSLLLYLVAVGMEIRADRLKPEQLDQLVPEGVLFQSDVRGEVGQGLMNRYPMVDWRSPLVPARLLGKLALSGILSLTEINQILAQHPLIAGWSEAPLWRLFYDWMHISASAYVAARGRVVDAFVAHEVIHPGEILHLAGELLAVEKCGDALFANTESAITSYISDLVACDVLIPDVAVFERMSADSWGSCGYQEQDNPAFKAIRRHLRHAVKKADRRVLANEAKSLLDRLRWGFTFESLHETGRANGGYGGVPIMQFIPVADFADVLIKDHLINGKLFAALEQRYFQGRAQHELAEEAQWLDELDIRLRDVAAHAPPPFKTILELRLDARLPDMRKNMADTVRNAAA